MTAPSRRALSSLAQRAIDRAIDGGQHQVLIDEWGRTKILPLTASPPQAADAALDAEIEELLQRSDGVGGH